MSSDDTGSRTADEREHMAQQFIEALPHARALGLQMIRLENGEAEIAMDYNPDFVGDPHSGVIHGGVISALMDTCSGAAVLSHASAPRSTATIDLRIDYMRAAAPGQRITATAHCYHVTRSVAFVRAQAMDEDRDNPVATATGTFTMER